MKIDIHTHIMPATIPKWYEKFGYGDFIRLEHQNACCANMIKGDKFFRAIEANCWDATTRIDEMRDTAVNVQVLSTIPVLFNYWAKPTHGLETSKFFNDHIASCICEHPHHFEGLGTLPLQDIDLSIQELRRCKEDLNLPGIEIGSNINGRNLSDVYFHPLWEACQDLDMCIFVHPWEMMGENDMTKYWLPWLVGMPAETSRAICSMIFGGVFEKFPRLRVAFAHGGGSFPATIGRIDHGFDVRPDLCAIDNDKNPSSYIGKFWIDSLVHDPKALEFIVDVMGEDRICLGSDYPFPLGEHHPGKLIETVINNKELQEKLLYKNAMDWLNK